MQKREDRKQRAVFRLEHEVKLDKDPDHQRIVQPIQLSKESTTNVTMQTIVASIESFESDKKELRQVRDKYREKVELSVFDFK